MISQIHRWIRASINKHFYDYLSDGSPFSIYFPGIPIDRTVRLQSGADNEYYAFPGEQKEGTIYDIDLGMIAMIPGNGYMYTVALCVVTLITVPVCNDMYRLDRDCGRLSKAYTYDIPVLRHGDGDYDADDQIGCLKLDSDHALETKYLGVLQLGVAANRAVISGSYSGEFVLTPL